MRFRVAAAMQFRVAAFVCLVHCTNGASQCGASTPVSVRDCGAVGDGKADDTAAIAQAVAEAAKLHFAVPVTGQRTDVSVADVVFPAGAYRVSSSIMLDGNAPRLVGQGNYYTARSSWTLSTGRK